jgi:hypothetical protein
VVAGPAAPEAAAVPAGRREPEQVTQAEALAPQGPVQHLVQPRVLNPAAPADRAQCRAGMGKATLKRRPDRTRQVRRPAPDADALRSWLGSAAACRRAARSRTALSHVATARHRRASQCYYRIRSSPPYRIALRLPMRQDCAPSHFAHRRSSVLKLPRWAPKPNGCPRRINISFAIHQRGLIAHDDPPSELLTGHLSSP